MPVLQELVVEMRARGETGGPDATDDLSLGHVSAGSHVGSDGSEMRVARPDPLGMPQLDEAAVSSREPRARDGARRRGFDRGARGGAVVDPLVRAIALEKPDGSDGS
jgi:hypothetical protein